MKKRLSAVEFKDFFFLKSRLIQILFIVNVSLSAPQHLKNLRLQCKNLWFLQTLWERHTPGDDAPRAFCSAVNLALIKYLCFPVDLLTLFSSLAFLPPSLWRQSPHCTASPPHIYSTRRRFCFLAPALCHLTFPLSSLLCQLFFSSALSCSHWLITTGTSSG